jgi:hypothetical protein
MRDPGPVELKALMTRYQAFGGNEVGMGFSCGVCYERQEHIAGGVGQDAIVQKLETLEIPITKQPCATQEQWS